MYSQFNEEEIICNYFLNKLGIVLDIGANDGKTFSNSLALIEKGWSAICVEPTEEAFRRLMNLHKNNSLVNCINVAITEKSGTNVMLVNGVHYKDDVGLLSIVCGENFDVTKPIEKNQYNWQNYQIVKSLTFQDMISEITMNIENGIDLITLDAEGYDYEILRQIDLKKYNVQMVIVETDNLPTTNEKFQILLQQQGFNLHANTITNLIFTNK
jgi:FkbM family methyltransferase